MARFAVKTSVRAVVGGAALAVAILSASASAQYAPVIGEAQIERFRQMIDMRVRDQKTRGVNGTGLQMNETENKAIRAVQRALQKKQTQEAATALTAAKGVVTTRDGNFVLAALQLQLGAQLNDAGLQAQAVDTLLAHGALPPSELPMLYRNQGSYAVAAGDLAKAETAYMKLVEVSPSDPEAYAMLAQTKNEVNKPAEALSALEKAIALKAASQEQVPETWTRAVQIMKTNIKQQ